jgi:broad-specificity NMP kinase
MPAPPDSEWIRPLVRAAIKRAGLDIYPQSVDDELTAEICRIVYMDRETSAAILRTAYTHRDFNTEIAQRAADVIERRREYERGIIDHIEGEDDD